VHVPVLRYPLGNQDGERRVLLGFGEREALRPRPCSDWPDFLACWRLEAEPLVRDRVIERDLDGGDLVEGLAVSESDDFEQHPALLVDLKPVAVSAAAELVQLEGPGSAARVGRARSRIGCDRRPMCNLRAPIATNFNALSSGVGSSMTASCSPTPLPTDGSSWLVEAPLP
jgi:hypothetical protein